MYYRLWRLNRIQILTGECLRHPWGKTSPISVIRTKLRGSLPVTWLGEGGETLSADLSAPLYELWAASNKSNARCLRGSLLCFQARSENAWVPIISFGDIPAGPLLGLNFPFISLPRGVPSLRQSTALKSVPLRRCRTGTHAAAEPSEMPR